MEESLLEVIPVRRKAEFGQFIRTPRLIYAGLPGFVPTLDLERGSVFSRKQAAFFKEGRAEYFLARRAGRIVGRISAQIDPVSSETWGDRFGLFGALDAIDDRAVVAALLEAALGWLRAQGAVRARGPYNLSASGESGLMIEGQAARPMIMMPWHPPYLAAHVEACGWQGVKDLFAYELAVGPEAEAALPKPRATVGGQRLTLRNMGKGGLGPDADIVRRLYNDAWRGNWGFVPLTAHDMKAMVAEMRPIVRRDHLVVAELDGEPVAIALIIPNLFDIAGDLGGSPSVTGWLKLAWRLATHRFRSARVILLGVAEAVRGTTFGALLPSLMVAELMRRGRSLPFDTVELGWILEDNMPMRRLIERLTPAPSKRYRLYERAIP